MPLLAEGAVLGLKHHAGRWASRCDLPIDGAPVALSGVAFGRSPLEAVTEAVDAATVVGETSDLVHPADVARALAVQAACSGADYMDVLNGVGEYVDGEELGSIFSSISRGLKSALPMAASFVPIPGAGLAAQMATHLIPGTRAHAAHQAEAASQAEHPPPGGVSVTRSANGAIVVRF